MIRKTIFSFIFVLAGVFVSAQEAELPGLVKTPEVSGLVIDTNKVVGGRVELKDSVGRSSSRIREAKLAARKAHGRTDICLDYAGEKLTWGDVEDYVDLQLLEAPLNIPPQATVEEINRIIANSKVRLEEIAINSFLKEAILAQEAKKAGIAVSDEELATALKKATEKSAKKKHGGKIVPKLLEPSGYFARNQRNYLLSRKYREQVIAPSLVISTNELAECIAARQLANEAAAATNALLKVKIEDFLQKIKAGELDFGETAYEHSDCGSCMDNGDWGEFEAENCSLLQPLKDFIFAPSKAEMSDVIETPYSYHIVKILKRYYENDEGSDDSAAPVEVARSGCNWGFLAAVLALAVLVSLAAHFVLRGRSVIVRVVAHTVVWGGAAIAVAVWVFAPESADEVMAPSRVHVAHIMLEKERILPELDEQTAFEEMRTKKLGIMTFKTQQDLLEAAQTNGTLTCAVNMTLLKKAKLLKKMKEANK